MTKTNTIIMAYGKEVAVAREVTEIRSKDRATIAARMRSYGYKVEFFADMTAYEVAKDKYLRGFYSKGKIDRGYQVRFA